MSASRLIFGSMRLHERGLSHAQLLSLLNETLDAGVSMIHSSSEYESYPLYRELLGALGRPVEHMVKLAEPHFGDSGFDAQRLVTKVERYLTELRCDRLDVVQWMWRGDLKQESARLAGLREAHAALMDAFRELREQGKIGQVSVFPYSAEFADICTDLGGFDSLCVYLNPVEQEMLPQIARAGAAGISTIAIRPLAAGKALGGASPRECVRFVLDTPHVSHAVVTFSSAAHLLDLLGD